MEETKKEKTRDLTKLISEALYKTYKKKYPKYNEKELFQRLFEDMVGEGR